MPTSNILIILLSIIIHCFFSLEAIDGRDTLLVNQTLSLNNTLVSKRGIFELGFFTPGSSLKEYVGVWYRLDKASVIWVANRELPVVKTPGKLSLRGNGVLEISDSDNALVWSSNSNEYVLNPVARMLDSGNFVVGDENRIAMEQFYWQGFDYPCDSRVTHMKIGYDKKKKRNVYQSSWKSIDDPAEGQYTFQLHITGIPQYFLTNGSHETFRSGPWNGETFSGLPQLKPNSFFSMSFIDDDDWIYFYFEPYSTSVLTRTVINVNGTWLHYMSNNDGLLWNMSLAFVTDHCDIYNWCGSYASCNVKKSPICECLKGYEPKSPRDWDRANWTEGCIRTTNCSGGDNFQKLSNIKVPDTRNVHWNLSWSQEECRIACKENCSCTAYGSRFVTYERAGCVLWFGELKDIKVYANMGQDIFLKGSFPESDRIGSNTKNFEVIIISSILSALVLVFVMIIIIFICHRRRKTSMQQQSGIKDEMSGRTESADLDLPLFDLETLSKATNNFSVENKLGEGGFGPVYKGLLQDGQEIAVKRLSHDSRQGADEFKNEAVCIAKLQHRNLVKLLGCGIQGEYMLIYEFMPNKSLDLFIFDDKASTVLDWPKRLNIINGIARGLLYLHQDSRLRIIHRDLKASNILLDYELNPKISDFGLARVCRGSETAASTTRVVGTYGYMPPEYAIDGLFSVKSDVYSFGVLVLEIISGRGNRGFYHPDHHLNLLGHTWKLFHQERLIELVDRTLTASCDTAELTRAIQVGLLCVQESPNDRPNMATAVLMLSTDIRLPPPKAPGFFTARKLLDSDSSLSNHYLSSINEMSVTVMKPR